MVVYKISSFADRKILLPTTFRDLYSLFHRSKAENNTIELQESNKKEKTAKPLKKEPSEVRFTSSSEPIIYEFLITLDVFF